MYKDISDMVSVFLKNQRATTLMNQVVCILPAAAFGLLPPKPMYVDRT